MRERGGGAIVNVSSVQAFAAQPGVAAYAATKGALNALTRAMAVDHAEGRHPGQRRLPGVGRHADAALGRGPLGERTRRRTRCWPSGAKCIRSAGSGQPEEVAELIAFLGQPVRRFITGAEYRVDGGLLAALGVSTRRRA